MDLWFIDKSIIYNLYICGRLLYRYKSLNESFGKLWTDQVRQDDLITDNKIQIDRPGQGSKE